MDTWKIWMDTGGTFTDCLSISPAGELQRLKLLSDGLLRGKLLRSISSGKIQVDMQWPASADIYKNYFLTIGTDVKHRYRVRSVDTQQGIVHFFPAARKLKPGSLIELRTGEEVPVLAARLLTQTALGKNFPTIQMKLGSTRGTNAILQKKGAKTALLITAGFKDLLLIGTQQRHDLFALEVKKELPLYDSVLEVSERMDSSGRVIHKLTAATTRSLIAQLKKLRIESIAVAFVNSSRNAKHEFTMKRALRKAGFKFISASHELSQQLKILPRAETAVANAYLDPIIQTYVSSIRKGLMQADIKVMTSAGGLVSAKSFYPKDSLLSGPAGGVVGAALKGEASGFDRLITFDMGGTSTDVSRYDKRFDYRYESQVGTLKILSPSLSIETIAAGGGSICSFDGHRFQVGPLSAGAVPGPACYGRGGPLTITDVNLLLGRIDPERLSIPIVREKSEKSLGALIARAKAATGRVYTRNEILLSFVQIANESMANAIRRVTTRGGHDPGTHTLMCFGGAGGQHACAVANMLRMDRIVVPYDAGLLSAYGIGNAQVENFEERLFLTPLERVAESVDQVVRELFEIGSIELERQGYGRDKQILTRKLAFLRFKGQDSTVEVDFTDVGFQVDLIRHRFRQQYEAIFGHWLEQHEIELESVRVVCAARERTLLKTSSSVPGSYQPLPKNKGVMVTPEGEVDGHLYSWEDLVPGAVIAGPALITSNNSTTFVETGWQFDLNTDNSGVLTRSGSGVSYASQTAEANLELFTNRFTALAQEMGVLLQRSSFSVNVKERLDFSCALLDPNGFLVVNAPHIPVHLGSLGVCVRKVVASIQPHPGDVLITNHPAFGGSHLPDVTLIKPVFYDGKLIGYAANRAHHAEMGGMSPGSMPAAATELEQEGVIIAPCRLVAGGQPRWDQIRELFLGARYPTRTWEENRADLNGALAAVNFGEAGLHRLCEKFGIDDVSKHMTLLRTYASELLQRSLLPLLRKPLHAEEKLDDGTILKVSIGNVKQKITIDFTGSSGVHPGNLNATPAIVQSVVLYVLRALVNQPLPMNEGLMDSIEIILPTGLLNPDFSASVIPAVVGGNTEVSQRLTDTLLKAFGLSACSQGTMNNFLFGNDHFGYYETICGGTGAGKGFHGTDAVHHHMTNTRITDPELLELSYPVVLEKFAVRRGSGGKGKWKGGNGVTRQFLFKENLDISILAQHRREQPYGLHGGSPGKTGNQWIIRKNGRIEALKGVDGAKVRAGDRVVIETPGGGGYGR